MPHRIAVVSLALLLALTDCAGAASPGSSPATPPSGGGYGGSGGSGGTGKDYGAPGGSNQAGSAGALSTARIALGTVIVDAHGMTVYRFDHDKQNAGTSACTGDCAGTWTAVSAGSGTPTASGVSGTLGAITGTDGHRQVTLDGWPLYTFSGDGAPGDANGQGVAGIWWVVAPSGAELRG